MVRTIARECFTLGTYIRWHLLVLATHLRRQEAEDRVRCRGLAVIWETEVARSNGFEKYRSVTLRVSSPVMDVARDAASEEGISLNSLANRQLRQYAEWDRLKHKLGYVTVRDRVFQHILEKLPEDEIVELGRQLGEVEAREYVMLNWRIMSPDHFIRFVDNYARYSGQFHVEHHDEAQHTLVLFHNLGSKWSLYLEAFMASALEASLGVTAKTQRTDQSVALTFSMVVTGERLPNGLARNGKKNSNKRTSEGSKRINGKMVAP